MFDFDFFDVHSGILIRSNFGCIVWSIALRVATWNPVLIFDLFDFFNFLISHPRILIFLISKMVKV